MTTRSPGAGNDRTAYDRGDAAPSEARGDARDVSDPVGTRSRAEPLHKDHGPVRCRSWLCRRPGGPGRVGGRASSYSWPLSAGRPLYWQNGAYKEELTIYDIEIIQKVAQASQKFPIIDMEGEGWSDAMWRGRCPRLRMRRLLGEVLSPGGSTMIAWSTITQISPVSPASLLETRRGDRSTAPTRSFFRQTIGSHSKSRATPCCRQCERRICRGPPAERPPVARSQLWITGRIHERIISLSRSPSHETENRPNEPNLHTSFTIGLVPARRSWLRLARNGANEPNSARMAVHGAGFARGNPTNEPNSARMASEPLGMREPKCANEPNRNVCLHDDWRRRNSDGERHPTAGCRGAISPSEFNPSIRCVLSGVLACATSVSQVSSSDRSFPSPISRFVF